MAAPYAVAVTLEPAIGFDTFVAAHGAALSGFALLVSGNPHDAHDLVQDALIGLYPRWARVAAQGDPLAYVRRSIVNRHISVGRKLHRLVALGDRDVAQGDRAAEVTGRDWALRMVGRLPDRQRVAVVLRVLEDQDFATIAEVLGVSEANARKIVARGLAALRTQIGEERADD